MVGLAVTLVVAMLVGSEVAIGEGTVVAVAVEVEVTVAT
jgi:hypothetical protein